MKLDELQKLSQALAENKELKVKVYDLQEENKMLKEKFEHLNKMSESLADSSLNLVYDLQEENKMLKEKFEHLNKMYESLSDKIGGINEQVTPTPWYHGEAII